LEHLQLKLSLLIKSTFIFVVLSIFTFGLTSTRTNSAYKPLEAADARLELSESTPETSIPTETVAAVSLPSEPIRPRDNRAIVLESYLRSQNSYLANYTDLIVELSDYYGVNPRLVIAMAGVESGYCRVNFRPYNCWGFGRYGWSSPEDGIRSYMALMNKGYYSRGARTIEGIASPYNPWPDHYIQKVYIHYNQMPQV
jgi:hypothetical protein